VAGADVITEGGVGARALGNDGNAVAGVAGDNVRGHGIVTADGVVLGSALDRHAVGRIGHGGVAEVVGADMIALDDVAIATAIQDRDAVGAVAGDNVAHPERGAANGVVVRAGGEP